MKRYLFYDKTTGEILHTHQVFKMGSDKPLKVSAEELAMLTNRIVDPKRMKHLQVNTKIVSSHRLTKSINVKTGKLVSKRIPRDYWKSIKSADTAKNQPAKGGK